MADDLFRDHAVMQHLQAVMPDGLHPTLVEIVEQMYLRLAEDGEAVAALGHRRLAEIALGQIDRVKTHCGGSSVYLPKGDWHQFAPRDQEIYAKFRGHNLSQLAREYKLSEMRIRQIVDARRAADILARQGKIDFGG